MLLSVLVYSVEPTWNYHLTLQFPSALWSVLASFTEAHCVGYKGQTFIVVRSDVINFVQRQTFYKPTCPAPNDRYTKLATT